MIFLRTLQNIIFSLLLLIAALSCREAKEVQFPVGSGNVELTFDPTFNGQELVLGETYTSPQDETLSFERFEYIISNIRLTESGGNIHTVPDSYYFMGQRSAEDAMRELIVLPEIPAGDYTTITFSIGVDPETNSSTDNFQKGELEIGVGMDWTWSTGYKFINWEGSYTNKSQNEEVPFVLHVGTNDNYQTTTLTFDTPLVVSETITADAYIELHAEEVFEVLSLNDLGLNFTDFTGVMLSPEEMASEIAEQWPQMFEVVQDNNPNGV